MSNYSEAKIKNIDSFFEEIVKSSENLPNVNVSVDREKGCVEIDGKFLGRPMTIWHDAMRESVVWKTELGDVDLWVMETIMSKTLEKIGVTKFHNEGIDGYMKPSFYKEYPKFSDWAIGRYQVFHKNKITGQAVDFLKKIGYRDVIKLYG